MRIGLLSLRQSVNDRPYRFISTRDAKLGIIRGTLKKHSKKLYQEVALNIIASSSPERHFIPKVDVVMVSNTVSISLPTTLNLFYPVKDQSTYAERNFHEIWGCNLEDWQERIGAV